MCEKLIRDLEYIDDLSLISKAYDVASQLHAGQFRASGEEYISHPIEVSRIVASMYGDEEVICASLLHDVIEDTEFTKEDVELEFGINIANLVDGVSKEDDLDGLERDDFNRNKLVLSSASDVRVMIIKLADRLHNMSTLEYKSFNSIMSNSNETMNFYVPVSSILGMRDMRRKLEDYAFKYLDYDMYEKALSFRKLFLNDFYIDFVKKQIYGYLKKMGIEGDVLVKCDGVLESFFKIKNGIENLFTIYVITDEKFDLPFDYSFVKVVDYSEYEFIQNGIASSFIDGDINDDFRKMGLDDDLINFNKSVEVFR